jgi:demethylmenaquinone methyltransferase/2-methoxy-6-polyprenyl-1,4-benzoquinol methylase
MSIQPPHPVLAEYYARDEDRRTFVIGLFDATAVHYDHLCRMMSLGSGQWYRRQALRRLGLRRGMRLLDVATGTGLVNRAAAGILGDPRAVVGLDPSAGMLREARKAICGPLVQGQVEELPFHDASFDVLTIGYALRHAADLDIAFRECRRVLKPDGRLLILEISRPPSAARRRVIRFCFTRVLPMLMALTTRDQRAGLLSRYYWDTIETCVAPHVIVDALQRAGFTGMNRRVFGGVLSEYTAFGPFAERDSSNRHVGRLDAAEPVTGEESK